MIGLLKLWFGLQAEVSRRAYVISGFALMFIKYATEAGAVFWFTQRILWPHVFFNPIMTMRQGLLGPPAPAWLQGAIITWTLPFLWIAVSMSVRRAANAGKSAMVGLGVLIPFINYLVMFRLAVVPTSEERSWSDAWSEPGSTTEVLDHFLSSALKGIAAAVVIALVMVILGAYVFGSYGISLFLGTPVLMGVTSAFLYNRPTRRGLGGTLLVGQVSVVLGAFALLLFAFEGIICLVMLAWMASGMALLGSLVGYSMCVFRPTGAGSVLLLAVALPLALGAESLHRPTPLYEVRTSVEIDAPPEAVWPHVIGFSELPEPSEWFFRLGISYPKRATIEGSGVGAVRRCEFSTGAFVEPITAWDRPYRLAFDVQSQPPPMHELSPYRHVHPPHLDGYLRSKRGEFRLVALPGGRTRLEGSTWYELELYPQDYWTLWSDGCIHLIHGRVLKHIKSLAEKDARLSRAE
jgi:hypothetical protein